MKNSIAERVKALRVGRGMNQTELAELLGVGQAALSLVERGINKPTIAQLVILSDCFSVSIDYIVRGLEVSVNGEDKAIINTIKEDHALYQSIMTIATAKKNIMSKTLQAA